MNRQQRRAAAALVSSRVEGSDVKEARELIDNREQYQSELESSKYLDDHLGKEEVGKMEDAVTSKFMEMADELTVKHATTHIERTIRQMVQGGLSSSVTELIRTCAKGKILQIVEAEMLGYAETIRERARTILLNEIDTHVRAIVDKAKDEAIEEVVERLGKR